MKTCFPHSHHSFHHSHSIAHPSHPMRPIFFGHHHHSHRCEADAGTECQPTSVPVHVSGQAIGIGATVLLAAILLALLFGRS